MVRITGEIDGNTFYFKLKKKKHQQKTLNKDVPTLHSTVPPNTTSRAQSLCG